MTDATGNGVSQPAASKGRRDIGLGRRKFAEWRLKAYGILAVSLAVAALGTLIYSIVSKGLDGLYTTDVTAEFFYDPAFIDPEGALSGATPEEAADIVAQKRVSAYRPLVQEAFLRGIGIDPDDAEAREAGLKLLSRRSASVIRLEVAGVPQLNVKGDPSLVGQTVEVSFLLNGDVKAYLDGVISRDVPEARRGLLSDDVLDLIDRLVDEGVIETRIRWELLTNTSSGSPEKFGLLTGLIGSAYMMLIVLVVAVPIGVAASVYLEEFAPKNRLSDIIEVNINNLAAVPSIVFGLLGLALFINFVGFERSTLIVGGLVLSLMTLPTVIIATRAALKAVPPSIRQAALGVGASKTQAVFHHVLPLALPGILTGTIIGLAQALGETAPLLVIGLNAFVQDIPVTPFDKGTSLPSLIYAMASDDKVNLWAPITSASIMVLLAFLMVMNLTAVFLRKRFERKW